MGLARNSRIRRTLLVSRAPLGLLSGRFEPCFVALYSTASADKARPYGMSEDFWTGSESRTVFRESCRDAWAVANGSMIVLLRGYLSLGELSEYLSCLLGVVVFGCFVCFVCFVCEGRRLNLLFGDEHYRRLQGGLPHYVAQKATDVSPPGTSAQLGLVAVVATLAPADLHVTVDGRECRSVQDKLDGSHRELSITHAVCRGTNATCVGRGSPRCLGRGRS